MIPHKNVFVMTAAFISIMLLIVARHHPPSRRKIKQIWHGRVYWESNTTMLRRPALNVSEAPSNVPSNNIKEPTASVSKSDDSSSKSDASISEIQVKNSEQKQTRIPTKHADESKMHGYDKPQISEPIITKDTMPLQIKTLTTNEYVTSAKSIVMIDNRPFELWKPTLESAIKYTDDDWSIELFVSRQYEGFSQVETFLKTLAPRKYNLKHYDMHFDASKIHKSISALFETESFWNEINSENVLILQADAVMCRSGVDDYLKYDYIGSPWSHKPDGLNVGNGGASFRKRSFMLKCLKTYHKHQTDPEDVYFSNCLKDLGSVPPVDIAKDFSMEAIWSDRPMLIHKPWLQKMLTKGRSDETVWKDICAMCPDISSIPFYKGKCTKNQEQNAEHEPGLQKLTIGKYPLESAQPFLSCDVWNELNIDSVYFLRPWEDNFPSFDQMSAFLEKRPATFVMSNQLARSWPDSKDIPVLKKLLDMPNLRKMYIMNPRIFHGKIMPLPDGPKWQHKTTKLYGESKIKTHKILSTVANDPKGVDQLFKKSRESIVWVRWMTDSPSNTNYEQENNALRTRRSKICAQMSSTNPKVKCDRDKIPLSDYFDKLKSVRFVASPAGYGLDTHGTWEALLAGCIPIVPHSPLDPMFDDLPVWLVNDWNEVTEEAMQEKEDYFSNQNWNFEKVFFTGWKKEIQGTINKISPEGHNQYKNPKDHDRAAKTVANKCALLFFGLAKHFNDIAFPSIQKYILNINPDCDVYAHTYDIKSITNPRNNEDHTPVNPLEVYSMTKNVVLDTLESVSKAIDFDYYHKHYKQSGGVFPYSMDNTLKQWFSIQRVWESMPTTYKRVGLFRLDVLYTEPVNIQNGDAVIPDFHHWGGLNDRGFYGLYKWAGQWATNRLKKLAIRSKQDNIYDINAEHFMKYMMRDVPVELKPMCFNRVRATGKIKPDCKPTPSSSRTLTKTYRCLPIDTTGNHKKMVIPSDKRQCLIESPMSERVSKLCDSVLGEPMANASPKLMFGDIHLHKNEYTMVGVQRLKNFAASIAEVNREKIPGAIVELGVWRGGGMMVASAINIEAIEQRELYLFDAFEENIPGYGSDSFVKYLQVEESFVKDGFLKFGVMNEHVHFRKGLFQETVPSWNKKDKIAVLRVDGNFYDSYQDAVYYMYESVPEGGIIIFDDVMSHTGVMLFWKDFKKEQGLGEDLNRIDKHSAWFRKEKDVVLDWKYFRAPHDVNKKTPCPVHIRECHPSWPKRPVSTKTYHSSKWEQLWIDNIEEWQNHQICEALTEQKEQIHTFIKDTCSATTDTDWCLIDDSVHQVWYNTKDGQTTLRKPSSVTTISPLKEMTPKDDSIWSYFELPDGTREYIEPLVSHLRHPLARCLFGDTFLTDRSYVLPGNPGQAKTFLFDAGASHWSRGAGGPSLSYFTSVWKRYGFDWSHIEGWEGGTTVAKFEATVPQEWRSRTHFHKDWISTSPDKQPFVPDVIRSTASKEDYVVFKLDIDSKAVETAIVDYLLTHTEALEYIDEFVWEHHVDNYIMAPNWKNTQDMTKSIADSYKYFLNLRKLGVRAHSWV